MTYAKKDIWPLRDELCEKYKWKYRIVYAEDWIRYIVQESIKLFWRTFWQKLWYNDFQSVDIAEMYIDNIIEYNEITLPQEREQKKLAWKIVKYYP